VNPHYQNGPGACGVEQEDGLCGEPVPGVASSACIHEHLNTVSVCAGCAVDFRQASGLLVCPQCEDGRQPHECLPQVQIAWSDGTPVTIVQEIPSGDSGKSPQHEH
jgi:hypothetical protein